MITIFRKERKVKTNPRGENIQSPTIKTEKGPRWMVAQKHTDSRYQIIGVQTYRASTKQSSEKDSYQWCYEDYFLGELWKILMCQYCKGRKNSHNACQVKFHDTKRTITNIP